MMPTLFPSLAPCRREPLLSLRRPRMLYQSLALFAGGAVLAIAAALAWAVCSAGGDADRTWSSRQRLLSRAAEAGAALPDLRARLARAQAAANAAGRPTSAGNAAARPARIDAEAWLACLDALSKGYALHLDRFDLQGEPERRTTQADGPATMRVVTSGSLAAVKNLVATLQAMDGALVPQVLDVAPQGQGVRADGRWLLFSAEAPRCAALAEQARGVSGRNRPAPRERSLGRLWGNGRHVAVEAGGALIELPAPRAGAHDER